MGLRDDKQQHTRARIIAAARALFARDGYEATTTRAIATRARIAHGTLFRYAPTKEDIVELVFESSIGAALAEAVRTVPYGSFVDVAMHFYDAFFAVYAADRALARVLVQRLPFLQGEAGDRQYAITFQLLAALVVDVEERQRRSEWCGDVVAFVVASSSFALYYSALVAFVAERIDLVGAHTMLREGLVLLERGCVSRSPS
jgi:AcrR family transcriptional regulator